MDCGQPTESIEVMGGASASGGLGQGGLVSQAPRLGRGGERREVAQFTPIGLNEIDGRQTVPEDGGVVDRLFSADWWILSDSGQNTKVGGAAHQAFQRKQDLFRKENSSRVGLDSIVGG